MRSRTCCFTGHRNIPSEVYPQLQKKLEAELIKRIEQGMIYFGTGCALGFDTMAAQTVLSLKPRYPEIRLISVAPCRDQANSWSEADKKIYNHILNQSDKVVYTSEYYYKGCMHKRNRHLVDHSSLCICYLTADTGGTAYTVHYAAQQGLTVVNLAGA